MSRVRQVPGAGGLALLAAFFALPLQAQTTGELRATDALRQCLQSPGSVRPVTEAARLDQSVAAADAYGWRAEEARPGLFRLSFKGADIGLSMDIQLPDASGAAFCAVYGPGLTVLEADAAILRFAQTGLLGPVVSPAQAPAEARTRYSVGGLPYQLDLMSWPIDGGAAAGLVFAGLPAQVPAAPAPPAAATPADAARINAALALELCLAKQPDGEAKAQSLRAAGFTGRVERSTTNADTTHYLTAPGGTVEIEYYYGETPEYCSVSSSYIGVTTGSEVLDDVLPRTRPDYMRRETLGPPAADTGKPARCVTYEDPTTPIGEIVGVAPRDPAAQSCTENGTVSFYITYRV